MFNHQCPTPARRSMPALCVKPICDDLPAMADLNLQVFEELQQAQARIDAALALLSSGQSIAFQTIPQLRKALVDALTQA